MCTVYAPRSWPLGLLEGRLVDVVDHGLGVLELVPEDERVGKVGTVGVQPSQALAVDVGVDLGEDAAHAPPPPLRPVYSTLAPMTHKTGLSIGDDDLWEWIEDQRITDDGIQPRSQTLVEVLELGRAAREILDDAPYDVDRGGPEQRMVRQALRSQIREELED